MILTPHTGLLLGASLFLASSTVIPPALSTDRGSEAGVADCRVVLRGSGVYQLEVGKAGPVPVVTFKDARDPRFDPISWQQGRPGSCNYPMGTLELTKSPNASALMALIGIEINAAMKVKVASSQRPQFDHPYKRLGNMAIPITQAGFLQGFREGVAAVAAELINRYANPASFLTDKGAKWVAEQGVKLMLQSYVEGRDPGLIIDGMLADMVTYLQGKADHVIKSAGGQSLQQSLKPHLQKMAADLTKALVEEQPEIQTVTVTATNSADDCVSFLYLTWSMKGGVYDITLSIRCGKQQQDFIGSVNVRNVSVEPGEAGAITATAASQLGVPMPLSAATITGVATVMPNGSPEPLATIAGAVATFGFTAANPRADRDYDNVARVTTTAATGTLTDVGRGKVTVTNVAPEILALNPKTVEAPPGGQLEFNNAEVTFFDRNADATNFGEVRVNSFKLTHPGGLATRPLFDGTDGAPQLRHDGARGWYRIRYNRSVTVASPHPHGTWEVGVSVNDDQGLTASTVDQVTVEDVPPVVAAAQASPQYVHRGDGQSIGVTLRVTDANGADDIVAVSVDATKAGGAVYTTANGLTEVARGPDWIDFRLDNPFSQTNEVGQHDIPVTVTDETGDKQGSTFLHVGNLAPVIEGYGMIFDADSLKDPNHPTGYVLVKPEGLCPGDHFSAGPIASDPEGDQLVVIGEIVETGAKVTMRNASGKIWIGDMTAPAEPGEYTVRITVSEVPPDKQTSVDMKITVIDCGDRPEDDPATAVMPQNPPDIAAAPADPSSQLLFGEVLGGILRPASLPNSPAAANNGGPSLEGLADSIYSLLEEAVPGDLALETYVISTGGSTGPVAQMFPINRGNSPVTLAGQAVVLEPVAITPEIQGRVTDLLQQFIAAGGSATVINAYCLEFLKKPPAAGTLMRIATPEVTAPFAKHTSILDASTQLREAGLLNPDSEIGEYFHAVRQWAIWTEEEGFDADGFRAAFLDKTRENLAAAGTEWSDEVANAVNELVPNRWDDIQRVLQRAATTAN